jgi:cyclic pyranopterin phosphate synthase
MEALAGATIALLTVYDMAKAMDKSMVINDIALAEKTGGTGGPYARA